MSPTKREREQLLEVAALMRDEAEVVKNWRHLFEVDGGDEVAFPENAACGCFLGNIIRVTGEDDVSDPYVTVLQSHIEPYLPPDAFEDGKAWDPFTATLRDHGREACAEACEKAAQA